jgi:H+/gluconate symporter-like permease
MEGNLGISLALLGLFVIMAGLMYMNRLPALLALPLMAVGIAVAAGVSWGDIAKLVVGDGMVRLHVAYTTAILGAILAQLVHQAGIAETLIRKTAELGGDRPLVMALLLTLVVALLFTTLGGLGAVIMVATIVFPILLSLGVPPMAVGCLFLFGLSIGGIFNLANWQLYTEVLGLSTSTILPFAASLAGILAVATVVFAAVSMRRSGSRMATDGGEVSTRPSVAWPALLTPLVPLVPVLYFAIHNMGLPKEAQFEFPILTAMLLGIVYGLLTTWRRNRSSIQLITRASFDGIAAVAPAVALMLGIGMVLQAVMHPMVSGQIVPLLRMALPQSPVMYVIVFGALAPLALYRGPLNLWGLGSGLVAAMQATNALSGAAIMAALFSVGLLQGVSDPTNTHNVWIANYLNLDVQAILKRTLPYVWIGAVIGLIVGAALFVRG